MGRTVSFRVFAVSVAAVVSCVFFVLLFLYFVANTGSVVATGSDAGGASVGVASAGEVEQAVSQMVSTTVVETTSVVETTVEKETTTTTEPEKSSAKNEIIFIGDSLLAQNGTANVLVPKLVDNGWQQISINAQGCRANHIGYAACNAITHFTTMLEAIENNSYDVYNSGPTPGAHQDLLKQLYANDQSTLSKISDSTLNDSFRQADTVVVSLGTNDEANAEKMEAGIRLTTSAIKTLNPEITMYWVKICAEGDVARGGGILNPLLDSLSQELSFELIDWASQCQASHQFDRVHYNDQGVEAFTSALAAGVN